MKKSLFILALLFPCVALAQSGALQGTSTLGGVSAVTQGAQSSNKLMGVIPAAKITIYLTGTTTLATLTTDGTHSLANPFYSNASNTSNPGGYVAFAATSQGYDVVASSGQGVPNCTTGPLCYAAPVTLCKDCYPSSQIEVHAGSTVKVNGGDALVTQNQNSTTPVPDDGYTAATILVDGDGNTIYEVPTIPPPDPNTLLGTLTSGVYPLACGTHCLGDSTITSTMFNYGTSSADTISLNATKTGSTALTLTSNGGFRVNSKSGIVLDAYRSGSGLGGFQFLGTGNSSMQTTGSLSFSANGDYLFEGGDPTIQNVVGFECNSGAPSAVVSNHFELAFPNGCGSGLRWNVPSTQGYGPILNDNLGNLSYAGTGSLNHAICWKANGALGYCSSVVASDGSCTCN